MLKKALILLIILAAAVFFSIYFLAKKAPDLLKNAIERSVSKAVTIRSIDYHFPAIFELRGFEIKETKDFIGETSFAADKIRLDVSILSLSQKRLIVNAIEVENADVVIRKYHGKLIHALSDAVKKPEAVSPAKNLETSSQNNVSGLPLEIHQFKLNGSRLKFIDHDIAESGFVVAFDEISAVINNIEVPFSDKKTLYKINARMPQGPEQKAAEIKISGRTQFKTKDSDTNIITQGVYLPYFEPYYRQVTPALIESAYLDSRIDLFLEHNDLTLNTDLEISGLVFRAYESEDQLFGLRADEILSFLKDRSGRLKLQFEARWNIADPSLSARDIIRKSIERSLKKTVIGNVGNILENVLQKMGNQGSEKNKESLEDKIKKLKNILKN